MIVVDTSVWLDHFRGTPSAADLALHLEEGHVLVHPWVVGEIALGNLGRHRAEILGALQRLPVAPVVSHAETLELIERRAIAGRGVGWVDVQIIASARACGAELWTHDGKMALLWRWLRQRDLSD